MNVENVIEKLLQVFLTIDDERKEEVKRNARKLFYLMAELINNDVKRCYPAIQFFSSGVETLGKVWFLKNHYQKFLSYDF